VVGHFQSSADLAPSRSSVYHATQPFNVNVDNDNDRPNSLLDFYSASKSSHKTQKRWFIRYNLENAFRHE